MTSGIASAPAASRTAKPSSSGICTSRKTSSGLSSRMRATASRPFAHSPAISTSVSRASMRLIRRRASGSSSTISTRILRVSVTERGLRQNRTRCQSVKRKIDRHLQAAFGRIRHVEPMTGPVKLLEPRARVAKPKPFPQPASRAFKRSKPWPVVPDIKKKPVAVSTRRNLDSPRLAARNNSMANRILYDRLQKQVGNPRFERLAADVKAHREAIVKPDPFDFEVAPQKLKLFLKRDLLGARVFKRHPQKVAKPRKHFVGCLGVFVQQRRDRVERVK